MPERSARTGMTELAVDLERRQITVLAALALLGGATVTFTACGGSASPTAPSAGPPAPTPPTTSSCPPDAACGVVGGDALHSAVITGAQLEAGGALVLDIRGRAGHSHTIEIDAQEVVAIREKRRIEKVSSLTFGHVHAVTFN
jgi:hypothetical protein